MPKKYNVFRDELDIKHPNGGIYCFMAFEYLDKNKKAIFKIGQTTRKLEKRGDGYHTYFPMGVTTVANLENPTNGKTNMEERKTRYEKIEKFIMKSILESGGYQIISTTKSRDRGKTEWVYTDVDSIFEAFTKANVEFGGKLEIFNLDDEEYVEMRKKKLQGKHYMAKIIYPLVDPPWVAPKGKKKK